MKKQLIFLMISLFGIFSAANAQKVSGELKTWHKVTITFNGPNTSETANPNPFTDFRLDVTFKNGSKTYVVPGYYSGCENPAEGCSSGNKWKVNFAPDRTGTWSYTATFKKGKDVAINSGGSSGGFMDGVKGTFNIAASNKSGRDFRAANKGRLQYVGEHYLRFSGTNPDKPNGAWFVKGGADSPENAFNYNDFDDTPNFKNNLNKLGNKTWQPHQKDYNASDAGSYTWKNGKGSEMLGMVNYLSSEGANVMSFLTFSADGDDGAIFPHLSKISTSEYAKKARGQQWNVLHKDRFDVSKMAQWDKVMEYADKKGMYLHFKTLETENDNKMDGNKFGRERKVYYRELIARFGYHLALNWNLTEETTIPDNVVKQTAAYIKNIDPYDHNIVIHTYPAQQDQRYNPLLGNKSQLTGASIQTDKKKVHNDVRRWIEASAKAGKKWVVANDEQGSAGQGIRVSEKQIREQVLWGTLTAGGAGVEYYYGYTNTDGDINNQDHRLRGNAYKQAGYGIKFFEQYFQKYMIGAKSNDGLTSANNDYVLANAGKAYAVYLPNGGNTNINIPNGNWKIQWYNPRNGNMGNASNLNGKSISAPDKNDWVALIAGEEAEPTPNPPTTGCNEKTYQEKNGVVAVEAEDFVKQTLTKDREWFVIGDGKVKTPTPDPDGSHASSASGGKYIEILPDTRVTHDDPLVQGVSFSGAPGKVAIIDYKVNFSSPGKYFVWVRAHSTGSEDNGIHVGIDGTWPATGARMQWCAGKNQWTWESKQRTAANHCGEAQKIFLNVPSSGVHTISFSMREDGFEMDKFVLSKAYTKPSGNGPKSETDCNDGGNPTPVEEPVNGGRVTTDKGATEIVTITGDGNADLVKFKTTSNSKATYIYIITDENGRILVTENNSHDFESAGVGICKVYGLSYTGNLQLSGKNINSTDLASGKFDVSDNAIIVDRRKEDTSDPTPIPTPTPTPNPTGSATYSPIHDAYVQAGKGFNINMVRVENGKRTAYLQFDLSKLEGKVTDASLEIVVNGDSGNGMVKVFKGTSNNWTENNISSANAPSKGSELGQTQGTYKLGEKVQISLSPAAISKGKLSLVIEQTSGNDFAFASKELSAEVAPKLNITTVNVQKTVTLNPIHDAYLQGSKRYNSDIVRVENGNRISYFKFDISKIKGEVSKANFNLNVTSDPGNGNLEVRQGSVTNWTENNLAVNNVPKNGLMLGSMSGNFNLNNKVSIPLINFSLEENTLTLIVTQTSGNDVAFGSKENTSVKAPELVITYTETNGAKKVPFNGRVIVYPNPFVETIRIFSENPEEIEQIELFDLNGSLLNSTKADETETQIDLLNHAKGTYLLVIKGVENKIQTFKVIKQ